MPEQPAELTEAEISDRLAARPDLLERFKSGDMTALSEVVAVGTDAKVKRTTIRSLA